MNNSFYLYLFRSVIVLFFLGIIYIIGRYLLLYLYPFLISFIIASSLQPIITFLEHKYHVKRKQASHILILLLTSLCLCTMFGLLYYLVTELIYIMNLLPNAYQKINQFFIQYVQTVFLPNYEHLQSFLPFLPTLDMGSLENTLLYITEKLYNSQHLIISKFISSFSFIVTSISQTSIILFFMFVSTYFMTRDFKLMEAYIKKLTPIQSKSYILDFVSYCKHSIVGLLKAHLLLAFITSLIAFIGFLILNINHTLLLTFIIFIVDLIPYIGIGVLFLPWILFLFLNADYVLTIQLASLYILIVIIRQFLEPKLIATHLRIHPLIALLILFITYQHFGVFSLIITPGLLVIISALYHANIFSAVKTYILTNK